MVALKRLGTVDIVECLHRVNAYEFQSDTHPGGEQNESATRSCLLQLLSSPWRHPSVSVKAYAADPASVGMARNPTPTMPMVN
jgi:hypothetical protein